MKRVLLTLMLQRTFPAAMALLPLPESTSMSSVLLELCRRPRCTDSRFVSKVDAACPSVCAYVCVFTPLVSRSAVLRRPVCWCNWDSAHSCGVDGRQWGFSQLSVALDTLGPTVTEESRTIPRNFFFFYLQDQGASAVTGWSRRACTHTGTSECKD